MNVCIYLACGVVVLAGEGCEEIFLIIATNRALISAFAPDALVAMHCCLRHTFIAPSSIASHSNQSRLSMR